MSVAAAPVVNASDLVKRFGRRRALDGATFQIQHGVTGLLGANGAGKTTLLRLILGVDRADRGSIEVLGLAHRRRGRDRRARIGFAPEHHQVPDDVRVSDFVRHLAEVNGLPRQEATGRASDVLWWVGLGEERSRPLGTLSTGQRQRAKLAAALAHDPDLVLLDEPTDGLDPAQRESMLELIRRVSADFGMSVIMSSHLLDEVERICGSVVVISEGRVAASGPIDELRGTPVALRVELDSPAFTLGNAARELGYAVQIHGETLEVAIPPGVTDLNPLLVWVRDQVAASGAGLRRLEPVVTSLEQVLIDGARR